MNNSILIVDDQPLNRQTLREILENDYEIVEAGDGEEALHIIEAGKDSIVGILLDIYMPGMNGYQVLAHLFEHGISDNIPVLIISSESSLKVERKCFDLGAVDYIKKPFDYKLVRKRVNNFVYLYNYKNMLEERVESQTQTLRRQYAILFNQADKLKKSSLHVIDILSNIIESRNLESGAHVQRVKSYTEIIANEMMRLYPEYGLNKEKIEIITNASAIHDIGKIVILDDILLKPGKLTEEEYDTMKLHTVLGCDILDKIREDWGEEYGDCCYEICRYHHERYDGGGYPEGLVGDNIPISAQIVSVSDVYDALTHERCYKDTYSKDEAFDMIINGECGVFGPKLMKAFENVREELETVSDLEI
ncbi:MAG: response regulator [Acetatifactor sp.]|nr:response regulator [Acetatifactor sp.]